MADFGRALKRGFEEVDRVWDARREIESVFDELAGAIRSETLGRVTASVAKDGPLVAVLAAHAPEAPPENGVHLAYVRRVYDGYPVQIEPLMGLKKAFVCSDRGQLEEALSELLQNVAVAEAIRRTATASAA